MRSRPSVTGSIELELPEFEAPPADPLPLLLAWVATAERLGVIEPYNVAIATSDGAGDITNRFVLAKAFDRDGMTFATNTSSAKGIQLAAHPRASAVIYWRETRQQLRLTGPVEVLTSAESDEIWVDRPILSQAAATASVQSEPLPDDAEYRAQAARLAEPGVPLPRPDDWNGYRLRPDTIEFWHGGADRMHRRLRYDRTGTGWTHERLYP
ncbi:pyridoxamine 5'-phosphate oxidase [Cryobacterium mesophilum]|uniref:Pyridoxamine 5'-phosphate oxidase n=1 Tax=Terrimesophilobacter mesophilus TaxID=433647 RepID=A0A4R8VDZ5_9MICO|nr:pyridoxal 5'-phosphate synthase [Terrimesophilobacter mesophilus]MBB5633682.1 pyridoxamine 5'-phosphate oxidase [Terrimesophilobacter mesophilus]TFB80372.1 pyridoxamine 5'-phosphate oxidase [Terrimesophilobacter mesophilus]